MKNKRDTIQITCSRNIHGFLFKAYKPYPIFPVSERFYLPHFRFLEYGKDVSDWFCTYFWILGLLEVTLL